MASTYSNLKIQLMTTGENATTWGNVTNINLGTALEEAIAGSDDVPFSSADVTLTLTDTNASQTARNLRLNLTGTSGGARFLYLSLPSVASPTTTNIEKAYIVSNGLADAVTVRNKINTVAAGTSVVVPAGKTMWVYDTGTDIVDAVTHLTSLTLASALPVASGGTGVATLTSAGVLIGAGTSAVTSVSPGTTSNVLTSNGSAWVSQAIPASGTVTSVAALTLGTTGTDLSSTVANSTTTPVITLNVPTASATNRGALSSANWTTFNNKAASGANGDITSLTALTSIPTGTTINGVVIGYRNIPRSTTTTTIAAGDVGKCIATTANIALPANTTTFAAGDSISIYNNSGSPITITQGASITMYLAGTATTGNRTLAQRGIATIWFNSTTDAVISGGGLS
jgi:hypothetical protein